MAEYDSLLVVGNDSVSHILCYFDVKQLCQCERTCKAFQRLSGEGWKGLDKRSGSNKSIVENPKSRCVRYVRASEYTRKMEGLASSHRWGDHRHAYERNTVGWHSRACDVFKHEVDDRFANAVCDFPDELATVDKADRELYLLIRAGPFATRTGKRPGTVLMEGFFPLRSLEGGIRDQDHHCVDLCSAHCPNWPEMEGLLSRQGVERDGWGKWRDDPVRSVQNTLLNCTVTLATFSEMNEPLLVATVDDHDPVVGMEQESDPWCVTISGRNPMKLHCHDSTNRKATSRAVEFGCCKKKEVIGFRLVETEHVLNH